MVATTIPKKVVVNGEPGMWMDVPTATIDAKIDAKNAIELSSLRTCRQERDTLRTLVMENIEVFDAIALSTIRATTAVDSANTSVDILVDNAIKAERKRLWGKVFRTVRDIGLTAVVAVVSYQVGQDDLLFK